MPRIAFHGSPGNLPSRLILARTRNGGRANAKLFAHEHEIVSARTRNYSRTNTKLIPHEHEMRHELRHEFRHEMRHEMPHEIARTKLLCECLKRFLVFGGRVQAGPGARKRVRGINFGAFSLGHSGRQLWGHFVQAISRGQFRAGNSVRAISRPCALPPAARARRLPPASQIACDWGAVAGCQRRPSRRAAGVKTREIVRGAQSISWPIACPIVSPRDQLL